MRYAAGNAEVLIDINAHGAVANLKMTYTRWDINGQPNPQGANFVKWVKTQIDKGAPVVFGGYLKEAKGDPDYDHIMYAAVSL